MCAEEKSCSPLEWRTTGVERRKRPKESGNKPLLLARSLWVQGKIETLGPEKRESIGWSEEGGLCPGLWPTFISKLSHFLFIHELCHLKKISFLRNKMNVIIKLHLRGYLWGLKAIMFLRCLSPVVTGVGGSVIGTVKKSISLLKAFVTFFSREMEGPRAEWLLFQATNLSGNANNHDRSRQTKLNNLS